MKLTHTHTTNRKSGMTLLELTVVILVLLSLISILFVGARAWKKGSDRSANIMNIRNTQQAMRGHENMRGLPEGAAFVQADLEGYMRMPGPVATVTYGTGAAITPQSAATAANYNHIWLVPSLTGMPGGEYGHTTADQTSGW